MMSNSAYEMIVREPRTHYRDGYTAKLHVSFAGVTGIFIGGNGTGAMFPIDLIVHWDVFSNEEITYAGQHAANLSPERRIVIDEIKACYHGWCLERSRSMMHYQQQILMGQIRILDEYCTAAEAKIADLLARKQSFKDDEYTDRLWSLSMSLLWPYHYYDPNKADRAVISTDDPSTWTEEFLMPLFYKRIADERAWMKVMHTAIQNASQNSQGRVMGELWRHNMSVLSDHQLLSLSDYDTPEEV